MVFEIIGGMLNLFEVVPTDEAHVRVMSNRQEVFMNGKYKNEDCKSSYWKIPFITKITKLPLTNIKIPVSDIKLNDINMAKFQCDIVCFVRITDPIVAAQRTGITVEQERFEGESIGIKTLANDFSSVMESISRTVTTKQTIYEIFKDRSKLDDAMTREVQDIFPKWGMELVDMQIKDIKDVEKSTIISDIEAKIQAQISSEARIKIAEENSKAMITEALKRKEAEMEIAKNEEEWQKRRVEKEQIIAVAEAQKKKLEAERLKDANEALVLADQKLIVGNAENLRMKIEQEAEANKTKIRLESEANKIKIELDAEANRKRIEQEAEAISNKINKEGNAQAQVIKATKLSEAEGLDKLAQAQAKFNEAALNLERIRAAKDVQIAQAKAYAESLQNADIKIVAGSTSELMSGGFFGKINVGPKEGASYDLFREMGGQLPIGNVEKDLDLATKVEGVKSISKKNKGDS